MSHLAALPRLETERLILRSWQEIDVDPFCALNADPEVMHFFPELMSRQRTLDNMAHNAAEAERTGFGRHAVEVKETGEFIGVVGLMEVGFDSAIKGEIEIGWRLSRSSWGQGYAREAALETVRWGLEDMKLDEVISFAPTINRPSIAVMKSIGMLRDLEGDFIHPALAPDSPLQPLEVWRKRVTR